MIRALRNAAVLALALAWHVLRPAAEVVRVVGQTERVAGGLRFFEGLAPGDVDVADASGEVRRVRPEKLPSDDPVDATVTVPTSGGGRVLFVQPPRARWFPEIGLCRPAPVISSSGGRIVVTEQRMPVVGWEMQLGAGVSFHPDRAAATVTATALRVWFVRLGAGAAVGPREDEWHYALGPAALVEARDRLQLGVTAPLLEKAPGSARPVLNVDAWKRPYLTVIYRF